MKRKILLLVSVTITGGLAATYLITLVVAEERARIKPDDTELLRVWVWDVLPRYPEIQELPGHADVVRSWARAVAHQQTKMYSGGWLVACPPRFGLPLPTPVAPDCLSPVQGGAIKEFVLYGYFAGYKDHQLTWKDALAGRFPSHHKKPSECLDRRFLDRYRYELSLHEGEYYEEVHMPDGETSRRLTIPGAEEVAKNREGLAQIANNRKLVDLTDAIWMIGYRAGESQIRGEVSSCAPR